MLHVDNLIVGAGFTGLCVAHRLQQQGQSYLIVDENQDGGLCSTTAIEGFFFDTTGHVIHHNTALYEDFVRKIMGANLLCLKRKAKFFFQQQLQPYPFQAYFYMLPNYEVVNECIQGLEQVVKCKTRKEPRNFEKWLIANFGKGISKNFLIPYNEKMWRFPLKKISIEWVEKYIPKPDSEQILRIAKGTTFEEKEYGYNQSFFYPKVGGINAFLEAIKQKMGEKFRSSFIKSSLSLVDTNRRKAILSNGTKILWNRLISTIPLPAFLDRLAKIPDAIKLCARSLKFTSLVSLNLGIRREMSTDAHWIYFPEKSIPFHRIVIQSNLSKFVAPDSSQSLIVERSLQHGAHFDRKQEINCIISHLLKNGIIKRKSDILVARANYIRYAYPIYDTVFNKRKYCLLKFLRNLDVYSIGRFGSWEYLSMEDCFIQAMDTAMNLKNMA
ncbi:MAG: NAD(P)-binding protein [Candidatus Bathyarchaeota archaeon]|nr:NAD(P)-binding protein [Candidatus Bathyarchaeota archaeon]